MKKNDIKNIIINILVGALIALVYIQGFYIISVIALSVFCVRKTFVSRFDNKLIISYTFSYSMEAFGVFLSIVVINGLIKNKLTLMEVFGVFFVGVDMLSFFILANITISMIIKHIKDKCK